jgi:hypothetical protein
MNLLSPRLYSYLNLLLGVALILSGLLSYFKILPGGNSNGPLTLGVFGLLFVLNNALARADKAGFQKIERLPLRINILVNFLLAIVATFSHYLLGFSGETTIVWILLGCSFLTLFSILFTQFTEATDS